MTTSASDRILGRIRSDGSCELLRAAKVNPATGNFWPEEVQANLDRWTSLPASPGASGHSDSNPYPKPRPRGFDEPWITAAARMFAAARWSYVQLAKTSPHEAYAVARVSADLWLSAIHEYITAGWRASIPCFQSTSPTMHSDALSPERLIAAGYSLSEVEQGCLWINRAAGARLVADLLSTSATTNNVELIGTAKNVQKALGLVEGDTVVPAASWIGPLGTITEMGQPGENQAMGGAVSVAWRTSQGIISSSLWSRLSLRMVKPAPVDPSEWWLRAHPLVRITTYRGNLLVLVLPPRQCPLFQYFTAADGSNGFELLRTTLTLGITPSAREVLDRICRNSRGAADQADSKRRVRLSWSPPDESAGASSLLHFQGKVAPITGQVIVLNSAQVDVIRGLVDGAYCPIEEPGLSGFEMARIDHEWPCESTNEGATQEFEDA